MKYSHEIITRPRTSFITIKCNQIVIGSLSFLDSKELKELLAYVGSIEADSKPDE